MAETDFIHLRVRSAYSLLDGATQVKALVKLAAARGVPALGISDPNLFGALEFAEACSGAGIQPVMGLALPVRAWPLAQGERLGPDGVLGLVAQDEAGWLNLMQLSSDVFLRPADGTDSPGCVPLERVLELAGGLIALTGGREGPLTWPLLAGDEGRAGQCLARLGEAFSGRLYVELQRHNHATELGTEAGLVRLAYDHDLPLVATNDVRYDVRERAPFQDILTCIKAGQRVGDAGRERLSPEHYLKTADEMGALFGDLPEALASTVEIARRCAVRPAPRAPILPRYVVQGDAVTADFTTDQQKAYENEQLKLQARAGLEARLAKRPMVADRKTYEDRLEFELEVIATMGFAGYFLIVADFIKWAKDNHVPVGPGRGSGAGSLVAYSLTITDLDPLRFGLLFERFLNPERVSMPDFDIDFCQDKREQVIGYVQGKYGADRVAQIITFGSLQARAAVRDVGRVKEMGYGRVDAIAKLIPNNPANPVTLAEAIKSEAELQTEMRQNPDSRELLEAAQQIEGLFRNASTHAAGVVIGDRPLVELVPLYQDPRSDLPATQWNMKWAEAGGLVKFDFLGLKTLTVIDRALGFLKEQGIDVDFDTVPFDDPATYALLRTGETSGVFQLESQGMRDTLRKMQANTLDDIIALISLYRPGPMANIEIYCDVKHGRKPADYMHPLLEPILKETQGVIVYQEQVMQIAQILSGYSLGEADLLRRAMGKKKPEEMAKQKARFAQGAQANGIDAALASAIFDKVEVFAGYGFNKSHAAAYAVVAYQTAWLKANHPVAFLAASMSLDIDDTDKLAGFVQEARSMKLEIVAPDINRSRADFSVEGNAIIYALGAVKTVGVGAMQKVVAARPDGGFASLHDVMELCDAGTFNKRSIETLAKAGVFDSLEPNRAMVVEAADRLTQHALLAAEDRKSSQASLFGESSPPPRVPLQDVAPWTTADSLASEFEALGLYLSGHPLSDIGATLSRRGILFIADMKARAGAGETTYRMAAQIRSRKERPNKRGERMAWLTVSDPTGEYEVMLLPEELAAARANGMLEVGTAVVMQVTARRLDEELRLTAARLSRLEDERLTRCKGLRVWMAPGADTAGLARVADTLRGVEAKDFGDLHIVLRLDDGREVEIKAKGQFPVDVPARRALKDARGVELVSEL
jgi:DNA polymerase III subunit alpha